MNKTEKLDNSPTTQNAEDNSDNKPYVPKLLKIAFWLIFLSIAIHGMYRSYYPDDDHKRMLVNSKNELIKLTNASIKKVTIVFANDKSKPVILTDRQKHKLIENIKHFTPANNENTYATILCDITIDAGDAGVYGMTVNSRYQGLAQLDGKSYMGWYYADELYDWLTYLQHYRNE